MKLIGKHTMILGKKGEGKSNFLQYVLSQEQYQNHLVYDMCQEHGEQNRYLPEHRRGKEAQTEFGEVLARFVVDNDRGLRPDLFVGEEMSRIAKNKGSTPEALYELIDLNRHYGTGFIGLARRPAKVNTDLIELADNVVLMYMDGDNDVKKLNRFKSGLGDAVSDLPEYHYITVSDRDWQVHDPVPEMDSTGRL